jgi:hypothetical protein
MLHLLQIALAGAGSFEGEFTGQTLRVDFVHTGTAQTEHVALERCRIEGPWPGSRTQLIDTTNLGKYLVEVVDLATNRTLYTRGFASIYGEWETTGEANAGIWRALPEAVRVPEPRRPCQIRLRKRQRDQSFTEIWSVVVDSSSRFVDRAKVAARPTFDVQVNGASATHVDLVFLGDGFTAEEMPAFRAAVRQATTALFSAEPFKSRKQQFNVRAVETPARASGVSRPRSGVFQESPLGARFNIFDSQRYVLTLQDRKWRDAAACVPYDFVIILVNARQYGGGGIHNLYATAATGSSFFNYLVVHEFGHSFAGLGDEYYTSDVAYEEFTAARVEPWEPNITALNDPQTLKWRDLVQNTPLPTPWNKAEFDQRAADFRTRRQALRNGGASEADVEALFLEEQAEMTRRLSGEDHAGKVGAFEGAMYESTGLYRPTADCIMFTRDDVGFCTVCRRAIDRVIDLYSN